MIRKNPVSAIILKVLDHELSSKYKCVWGSDIGNCLATLAHPIIPTIYPAASLTSPNLPDDWLNGGVVGGGVMG